VGGKKKARTTIWPKEGEKGGSKVHSSVNGRLEAIPKKGEDVKSPKETSLTSIQSRGNQHNKQSKGRWRGWRVSLRKK